MTVTRSPAVVPFVIGGPESAFRVGPVTADGDLFRGTMETGNWIVGPDGAPCSGSLGVLVDDILGYPVAHARPSGNWATSMEISVSFCGPLPADGSAVRAESRVVSLTASSGLTQAQVQDAAGRTIAVASQRLRFITGTPAALSPGGTAVEPAGHHSPDGTTLEQLGASITRSADGAALALPLGPSVANPMGTLHGGILLCATELAGHAAVQPRDHLLTTSSVNIAYLRPGPVAGEATFEAAVLHQGRTLAVAQVVSRTPEGKVCTLATVTCHREA